MPQTQTGQGTSEPAGPGLDMPLDDDGRPHSGRDVLVGLFFLAWAGAGWISIGDNAQLFIDFGLDPGPSLLPIVVLTALSAGGLAILATGVFGIVRNHGLHGPRRVTSAWTQRLRPHAVPGALLATLVGYPTLMHAVGYIAATAIFVLGWILALTGWRRATDGRAQLLSVLVAVAATAIVVVILYAGFVVVIHAPLP